jgi:hypothetical protein
MFWLTSILKVILVVGVTLAVAAVSAALLVVVLAPRQLSIVAAFEGHRLSGGHTLAAEVSADQAWLLDSTTVGIA